ncbi:ATP-binding protein [Actinomadura madurae]|uniref:ATP-binding protein n=1 Tax=Actinomadura madurae TaxID=1993 RepID=UPI0020D214F0|nr:ATP-binding protein [Actinomadura madurae]MCQ0013575.1 ATP-binding protein [Actinomadura madurae]
MIPRQLPARVDVCEGRARELLALERDDDAGMPSMVSIEGMPGVGKTALAVHAAHRLMPRFPDGQLYLDLHGHRRETEPVEPGAALTRLLGSLGVTGGRVPEHLDDRAALYRSVLAGRRVLIVLDDAAGEEQVRPLLPAGAGCRLIVTSRRRLIGLDGVRTVPLDVPAADEAVALFTRTAGRRACRTPRRRCWRTSWNGAGCSRSPSASPPSGSARTPRGPCVTCWTG